jgi:tetrahydrodipicolinate N-succinyltransferase
MGSPAVTINACTFTGNAAHFGGGVSLEGSLTGTVNGSYFANNTCYGVGQG